MSLTLKALLYWLVIMGGAGLLIGLTILIGTLRGRSGP